MSDVSSYDELEGRLGRAWHTRYAEPSTGVDASRITREVPTRNQSWLVEEINKLADELGDGFKIKILGKFRDDPELSIPVLRRRLQELKLKKQGMQKGSEVQRNGRIRTIQEIDFEEGFVRLSFKNRYGQDVFFRIKISNLLNNYEVVPAKPE